MLRVLVLSVVPSPYQRDLFQALASRPEIDLSVRYMEANLKGYPWQQEPLAGYEQVLSGGRIDTGRLRLHWNWGIPDFRAYDVTIFNTYLTSVTAQWAMRCCGAKRKWLFWGERLRPQDSPIRRWIQNNCASVLGAASGIAAIGKLAVDDYSCRFPGKPVFNIPYHCTLEGFMHSTVPDSTSSRPLTFLFCGIMNERKGVDLLLLAFDRLVSSGRDVRLLLVGQAADNDLFAKMLTPPSQSRVRCEPFQMPENLPILFGQADVLVLPSRHDGWGVVVNQALGAGLAVIGSRATGAAHDLIDVGKNGLMFETGNVDELFRCMKTFADEPGMAARFGETSRAMAADWTPESGATKWVNALRQIVGHD